MQTTTLKLYSLGYSQVKTYIIALIFIVGNLLLPQIVHIIPQGGLIFLPIYFFTLIAAYKYGWKVGLITAILSPIANYVLFGMPALAILPAILIKSVLLSFLAAFAAHKFKRVSLLIIAIVILSYQIIGTLFEWAIAGDFLIAIQDFRIGIPGMLIQLVGGYYVIKHLDKIR